MGYCLVTPEPVRLTLADGTYIIVKKRLTQGDHEDMVARMSTTDSPPRINPREVRRAKVLAYLLGWSFTDGDEIGEGLPIPMSPSLPDATRLDTLRNLDPEIFAAIHDAIEQHEAAMEEERQQRKKSRRGELVSSVT